MRASLLVVALFVAAGMAVGSESSANLATEEQPADAIIVLQVEGMT